MKQYWGSRVLLAICFIAFVVNVCNYIWSLNASAFKPFQKPRPESHRPKNPLSNHHRFVTKADPDDDQSDVDANTKLDDSNSCPELPHGLGPMPTLLETITKAENEYHLHANIKHGGYFFPECKTPQDVAVIVPFPDVRKHEYLKTFVYYMHMFLMKQQVEYQLFTVENSNKSVPFNRAQLFNIGFREAQLSRPGGWSCVVLHEPHLLPLDSRNLFRCGWYPRQLITRINDTAGTPYARNFGGAIAINHEQFKEVNGFPNTMVDDETKVYEELLKRIETMNYAVEFPPENFGKYSNLKNITKRETGSVIRSETSVPYRSTTAPASVTSEGSNAPTSVASEDGITSLLYRVDQNEYHHLHHLISITALN